MKRDTYWKTLFSQSGSEIYEVSKALGRFPDTIVCNRSMEDLHKINPNLLEEAFEKIVFVSKRPSVDEYKEVLKNADIVSLHGFLRILPPGACNLAKIYNGHPGLITLYPELKGKDPQAKVWLMGLRNEKQYLQHGHVIHEVVPEVDAGKVVSVKSFTSADIFLEFRSLESYIGELHKLAINNWVDFLRKRFNNSI